MATECTLAAGELEARFLPEWGMLGVSLRHRGEELLRRLDNLEVAAAKGSTAGIPLLYPWANRLAAPRYSAAGKNVALDPASPLLHPDEFGQLIHGVRWALLNWEVLENESDHFKTQFKWDRPELLAVFPYRHRIEMTARLTPSCLTIETNIVAQDSTPVSFGFHPYFGIPGLPREKWRVELPAMRKLVLDERGIPTGKVEVFERFDGPLGDLNFDAGFVTLAANPKFVLSGAGRRIAVEFLENYPYAQVFAPRGKEFIALEPMTAPTNALISSQGLRIVEAGQTFRAVFQIGVS